MRQKQTRTLQAFRATHKPPLTQADAARLFGVSQVTWGRWERGEVRPPRRLIPKLLKVTRVPLEVLMGMAA